MRKIVASLLLIIATSCSEDELISDLYFSEIRLESEIEVTEVVDFNGHYIFGGYDGFMITDQNFNIIHSYEQDMILDKIVIYDNSLACVCTDAGIFKIDQANHIEKILDVPCTDMEIDKDGKILFASGVGLLSSDRQIPANILELDVDQRTFSYYSDPTDSRGVFLDQIEILDNGEIFMLTGEASIFRYKDKAVIDKLSVDNINFFPEKTSGLNQGYIIHAIGNQLYFTIDRYPKRLLKYDSSWEQVIDVGNKINSEKERLVSAGSFFDLEEINGQCVIGTQNGLVRVGQKNEFDLVQYQNLSYQVIRKIYTNSAGKLIFILADNIVAIAQ